MLHVLLLAQGAVFVAFFCSCLSAVVGGVLLWLLRALSLLRSLAFVESTVFAAFMLFVEGAALVLHPCAGRCLRCVLLCSLRPVFVAFACVCLGRCPCCVLLRLFWGGRCLYCVRLRLFRALPLLRSFVFLQNAVVVAVCLGAVFVCCVLLCLFGALVFVGLSCVCWGAVFVAAPCVCFGRCLCCTYCGLFRALSLLHYFVCV